MVTDYLQKVKMTFRNAPILQQGCSLNRIMSIVEFCFGSRFERLLSVPLRASQHAESCGLSGSSAGSEMQAVLCCAAFWVLQTLYLPLVILRGVQLLEESALPVTVLTASSVINNPPCVTLLGNALAAGSSALGQGPRCQLEKGHDVLLAVFVYGLLSPVGCRSPVWGFFQASSATNSFVPSVQSSSE